MSIWKFRGEVEADTAVEAWDKIAKIPRDLSPNPAEGWHDFLSFELGDETTQPHLVVSFRERA